ncbi:MAG: ABC transporter ATP-binding protein/permease [Oscillospiraceae bacterium]|nr:ABC transporter ATP-binding protein/permease [Oscillospiraceae bacterium]
MKNKKEKVKMPAAKTINHNWFVVKIISSASPYLFMMMCLDNIRWHGMNFVLQVAGVGFVLRALEFGYEFRDVLIRLLILIGIQAVSAVWSAYTFGYVVPVFNARAERKLRLKLYEKARSIDLSCYDDPEYYNNFVLSVSESGNAVRRTMDLLGKIITGLLMFIAYGTYFLLNDWIAVLFVIGSFAARFLIGKAVSKLKFKVTLAETPFIKKRGYIHRVFYLNDYAKELRLNKQVTSGLYKDFRESNDEIYNVRKSIVRKAWGFDFLSNYVFNDLIYDGFYLAYLVYKTVVSKAMAFSSMFILWNIAGSMRRSMVILSEILPQAVENALYIEKIRSFLDYETMITSEKNLSVPKEIGIVKFENVSFRYNEKQDYILSNINLEINPLDKIALVGYNGAGKTTLIKLLMRLYDPAKGRITLDGVDIRDFNPGQYRELIGTIFQDYRIYAASVEQNITMDLIDADEDLLYKSIKFGGFEPKLREMEKGVKTPLTREFDDTGTALSGGESQKLATARVFYKPSNLIVLDEPSSALDPIAEYQMNRSMNRAAEDKSVVFISHRLSTTKHADKIFMMENGRIIEQGTHDELLESGGKYTEMWQAQASKYV